MKRLVTAIWLLSMTNYAQQSVGASFDCRRAASSVETAICGDETLSAADEEMARQYRRVKSFDEGLVADQSTWLREVRNRCTSDECLSSAYLDRIGELEKRISTASSTAAPLQSAAQSSPSPEAPQLQNRAGSNAVSTPPPAVVSQGPSNARTVTITASKWGLALGIFCLIGAFPKSDRRFKTGYKNNAEPSSGLICFGLGLILISGILLWIL